MNYSFQKLFVLFILLVSLTACDWMRGLWTPATFQNTDITGMAVPQNFAFTDHQGKPRKLADFKGKVAIIFFGYTHCPDICPTTMMHLANLMQRLDQSAQARTQVLFITMDPARDTSQQLAIYLRAFDPRFIGLNADTTTLSEITKTFKAYFQPAVAGAADYTLDHSSALYILDTQGKIRILARQADNTNALAHDINLLLAQAR